MDSPPKHQAAEEGRDDALDRALGDELADLPPNEPRGILGETNPDVRKEEDYTPDLNAGISQENDMPVLWLGIFLGYLVFFVPGFLILWLSKRVPTKTKWIATAVGLIGVVAFLLLELRR
jgi:hypothetical protein